MFINTSQQLNSILCVNHINTNLCERWPKERILPIIPFTQTSRTGEKLNIVPEVRAAAGGLREDGELEKQTRSILRSNDSARIHETTHLSWL